MDELLGGVSGLRFFSGLGWMEKLVFAEISWVSWSVRGLSGGCTSLHALVLTHSGVEQHVVGADDWEEL